MSHARVNSYTTVHAGTHEQYHYFLPISLSQESTLSTQSNSFSLWQIPFIDVIPICQIKQFSPRL